MPSSLLSSTQQVPVEYNTNFQGKIQKLSALGMPYNIRPWGNSFSSTDDSWCLAPGLPLLANQTSQGPEIWCKKAIVGPPPPHPGSSPSLADDKLRLCLGKVQCYISDLSDPKTPGMEKKKVLILPLLLAHPSQHLFNTSKYYCFSIFFSPSQISTKSLNLPSILLPKAQTTSPTLYLLLSFFSVHRLIL